MNITLHDTLSVSKRQRGAGMKEPQAEAVAGAIRGGIVEGTAHLATKKDLATMESRLEAKISETESRLVWRAALAMFAHGGLVVAILRLFPP